MKTYLDLMAHVLEHGDDRMDRTGVGTRGVFGASLRYDLTQGFPLLTTKKIHTRSVIYELLWFLSGQTNISYLKKHNVSIWNEWANENGDLGPVYGSQWRQWGHGNSQNTVDQISNLIHNINTTPQSRRLIVTAWNPSDLEKMALPPCHCLFQFYVRDNYLDCQMYQRSADIFLGVPFNIASYALLTSMIAQITNLKPGVFVHTLGDAHLYKNHFNQARQQLKRAPRALPKLELNTKVSNIFDFRYEDITIVNYNPHSHIAAPVAV